jgi:SAM-dependent methyltransferase
MYDRASVKLAHEHYLDEWLTLYEYDDYKRWLFSGIIKILKEYAKHGTVLELGCSKGYLCMLLDHEGYHSVGGDISLTALRSVNGKIEVARLDGEVLPFTNGCFDAVLAMHALEHLPKPHRSIEEIFRVLKDKGIFLAITPDRASLLAKLGYRLVKYTSLKNPYHVGLMNSRELRAFMRNVGFKDFMILPFHNGFLGAPVVRKVFKGEFIPLPISTKVVIPFSHHQLVVAIKSGTRFLWHEN